MSDPFFLRLFIPQINFKIEYSKSSFEQKTCEESQLDRYREEVSLPTVTEESGTALIVEIHYLTYLHQEIWELPGEEGYARGNMRQCYSQSIIIWEDLIEYFSQ